MSWGLEAGAWEETHQGCHCWRFHPAELDKVVVQSRAIREEGRQKTAMRGRTLVRPKLKFTSTLRSRPRSSLSEIQGKGFFEPLHSARRGFAGPRRKNKKRSKPGDRSFAGEQGEQESQSQRRTTIIKRAD